MERINLSQSCIKQVRPLQQKTKVQSMSQSIIKSPSKQKLSKQKSISAIKTVTRPKVKLFSDEFPVKITTDQNLSKKQLLLKLEQIKQIKLMQYRNTLLRSETQKRKKMDTEQVQRKKIVYSNLQNLAGQRQLSSSKKQIEDGSQSEYPFRYKSNFQLHPMNEIGESKERERFMSERKKVVSVGAGFKKRAVKLDQHHIEMGLRREKSEFKISRSVSRKVLYKEKIEKVEKETQMKEYESEQNKKQMWSRSKFQLVQIQNNFWSQSNNNQTQKTELKYQSNKESQKAEQKRLAKQISLFKINYQKPQKLSNFEQLIEQLKYSQSKRQTNQNDLEKMDLNDKDYFEQNGFGISMSLEKFDLLCLEDHDGQVFNKLFIGQTAKCPVYQDKAYLWADVRIIKYSTKTKKVIVQFLLKSPSLPQGQLSPVKSRKNSKEIQLIEISRMSLKIDKNVLNSIKLSLIKRFKEPDSNTFLSESEMQIVYMYLFQDYWQRVKLARKRLNGWRNYNKYLRYLKKLPSIYSLKDELGFQPNYQSLANLLTDYKPSQNLNFEKRVPFKQAIYKMVTDECHELYSKHFLTLSDMFRNPLKFTDDINLPIKRFKSFKNLNSSHARDLQLLPFRNDLFSRAKQMIQEDHYSRIPNFMTAIKNAMRLIFQCRQESLNLQQMTKKLSQQMFGQVNSILQVFMRLGRNAQNKTLSKGMSLQNFISQLTTNLQNSINKVTTTRQHIISQVLYHLKDSFLIQSTTRTKQFLQQVQLFKKSMKLKYYSLITQIHIELINQLVYEARVKEFFNWISNQTCLQVFRLRVYVVSVNNQKKVVYDPPIATFTSSLADAFDQYHRKLLNVNSLLGDLLIKPTSKIPIFNPLKKKIKSSIDGFAKKNYQTVASQIRDNIEPLLKYFSPCNFQVSSYSFESIDQYDQLFNKISKDVKDCKHFFITSPTVFVINLDEAKQSLTKQMRRHKEKTLKRIQKQVIEEVNNKYKEFTEYSAKLSLRPKIEEQYLQMRQFLSVDCDKFMINAQHHFRVTEGYFSFFQDFSYDFSFEEYVKSSRLLIEYREFKKRMQLKSIQLDQVFMQLIERINYEREQLSRFLDAMRFKLEQITRYSVFSDYPAYYVQTNKSYMQLVENANRLSDINRREGLLKQEMSIFPTIRQLQLEIHPYYELYSSVYEVKTFDNDWKDKPLMDMNHKNVKELLDKNSAVLQRIGKTLVQRRNAQALAICELAKSVINSNVQLLWMVEYLTKEAMLKKPLILKEAMDCIFQQNEYRTKEVTLNELLKQNITTEKRAFVIEKCLLAQKIYNLQKQLQGVVSSCKKLYFEFKKSYKLSEMPYIDQAQLMFWLSGIREEKQTVEIIEGDQVAHMINKKIQFVLNKVLLIESTLEVILSFQQLLFRISKIMLKQEIKNEFSSQQIKKINDTESLWRNTIITFNKQLQLWQSIDSDSHKNKLSQGCNLYHEVLKKIQTIVQQKIKSFPKLYFAPKQKLIQLLQEDNTTELPQSILNNLFGNGFRRLVFKTSPKDSENTYVEAVEGQNGQIHKLRNLVNTKAIFWLKYAQIDDQLNKSIKTMLTQTIQNTNSKDKSSKLLISEVLVHNINWTADMESIVSPQASSEKYEISQKWLKIQTNNKSLSNTEQRLKQIIYIQNKLFLRDMTQKILKYDKAKRVAEWQKTPKYRIAEYNRQQKLCISVTTKNPSDNKSLQLYLPFGSSLPDYQSYPLHQFSYSESFRMEFTQYMSFRELEYKSLTVSKEHKDLYEKIALHTLNHYVNPTISNQPTTNIIQTLKHYLRGFLLSESFGLIDIDLQDSSSSQKLELIKYLAYTLEKVNLAMEQKAYNLEILDINVKVGKNYRANFGFIQQNITVLKLEKSVQHRLLKTRIRHISLCDMSSKQICLYLFESLAKLLAVQQIQSQSIMKFVAKVSELLTSINYSGSKSLNFLKETARQVKSTHQGHKLLQLIIKKVADKLSRQNSRQDLMKAIEKINFKQQFSSFEKKIKQIQSKILLKNQTEDLIEYIECLELEKIKGLSFQEYTKLQQSENDRDQKQSITQAKLISIQAFTQAKQKFISSHFIGKLHNDDPSKSITKNTIIIYGDQLVSGKTQSILKTFARFIQKSNTFNHFLNYIYSSSEALPHSYQSKQFDTLVCNSKGNKIIPLVKCHNKNQFSLCHKWHYYSNYFIENNSKILQSDNNLIIESNNLSDFSQLTPSTFSKVVFFHLPPLHSTRQSIIEYQFSKRYFSITSVYLSEARRLFILLSKDQVFDSSLTELKFISVLKSYLFFVQAFQNSIQMSHKPADITEFLLMMLVWSLFPLFKIEKTNIKPLDFGSTFQKPFSQIYNWYYSLQKHTWIEWVSFTQFIDCHKQQRMAVNKKIYIPINESVSFTFFVHKLSTFTNCLLTAEQKGSGLSFLTQLIQIKGFSSKCSMSGPFSMEGVRLIFQKQSSKTSLQGILAPNKDRSVKFIIQDVNLSFLEQTINASHKRYLISLFNHNFDTDRKQFFEKIHFILCFSEQNQEVKQKYNRLLCKNFAKIKLKSYSEQSCKYIFKTYLDEFFGNTENPYSKDIRETTILMIYELIQMQKLLSIEKGKKQIGFGRFLKILRGLELSTPKVVKDAQHILGLLQFELKRQLMDAEWFYVDYSHGSAQRSIVKAYNKTLNIIIEKLFFNQQLQLHKEQLGLKQFNHQKLQSIRQLLTSCKFENQGKVELKRFQKDQIVYCKFEDGLNNSPYKQYYRFYDGIDKLSKMMENSVKVKLYPESQLPLIYGKEFISDLIRIMRLFTHNNTHALIHGFSLEKIQQFCSTAVSLGSNYKSTLHLLQMQNSSQIKDQLKTLLKKYFKLYLKSPNIPQITILVTFQDPLNQQNQKDLQLICQYLETNQFISWFYGTKSNKYNLNLSRQLKIKSLQSPRYQQFIAFCSQKIHFIFGLKISPLKTFSFFSKFPSLLTKTQIKLHMAQMSDFSQIQISTRSILINQHMNKETLLLYKLFNLLLKTIKSNPQQTSTKYQRFCQLSNFYIQQNQQKISTGISIRNQVIGKINQIFQFKKYLERKLQRLESKELNMKAEHQVKIKDRKILFLFEREKYEASLDQQSSVQNQEHRCKQLQAIVDQQISKVGPILTKAQTVLQKVTRDDINQLRSFPNPPLPAAKVCQSLVFLFDEVHLIKEKVLQTGEKVKDFWEYAKKQILNDKLVKRISEYSQQTIKNFAKQVIETVREITKKQQFQEERVFKASGAAGNLSLWVRAVIQTYDVLEVIQPKKKQLHQNEQNLKSLKQILQAKISDHEEASNNLNNKNLQIQKSSQQLLEIKHEIISVKQQISNIDKLLVFLIKYKDRWNQEIAKLSHEEKMELNYFSIWSAFTQVLLIDLTQSQVIKFFNQLTNAAKVDVSDGFIKWIKKTHWVRNSFKITFQSEITLLTLTDEFVDHISVVDHFISNHIPHSKAQIFLNKITSLLRNLQNFDRNTIKSCWIVDETSITKSLFGKPLIFNKSQLSHRFCIQIAEVIDCMKYQGFDHYLKERNMQKSGYNEEQSYSDEQSEQQGQKDEILESSQNLFANKSTEKKTQIVVIRNIQHCLDSFGLDIDQMLSFFNYQKLVPLFLTDFQTSELVNTFKQVSYFSRIDLSQATFKQMILNGINFLKLDNSKTHGLWLQVYGIKAHYDQLLKKLSLNPQYNQNQTYAKIQNLLQNDNQVQILIQAFITLQSNQSKLQTINKEFLSKKTQNQGDELSSLIKKLYSPKSKAQQSKLIRKDSVKQQSDNQQLDLFNWISHITFQDFMNKYLVQNFTIFQGLKELKHSCHDKPQEQFTKLINGYLAKDHRETLKNLNKFVEYLAIQGRKYKFRQRISKIIKKERQDCLAFSQVINCLVLQQKTEVDIISELKRLYEQSLIIIDQSVIPQNQKTISQGDLLMYYKKRSQIVILSKGVTEANELLQLVQSEVKSLIYKNCIHEKEMDERQLVRYLNEHEDFKVFVLLDQKYSQQKSQNDKENTQTQILIRPWSKQHTKKFFMEENLSQNIQASQIQQEKTILDGQILKNLSPKKLKGAQLIKSLWKQIDQQDQQMLIIERHIKIYYNII